jgi:hypothetical protein
MSVQVKRRRDTATNVAAFTGAQGELIVDTTNNRLRVMDGSTSGGWPPGGTSPATIVEEMDGSNVRHGGNIQFGCLSQLLSGLTGLSAATTIQIPNTAIVVGVSVRVTTAITGAGSFRVDATISSGGGAGGTSGQFGAGLGVTAGTTNAGVIGPTAWYAASTITLRGYDVTNTTPAAFTAGAVRVQINYMLCTPPTS